MLRFLLFSFLVVLPFLPTVASSQEPAELQTETADNLLLFFKIDKEHSLIKSTLPPLPKWGEKEGERQ
jgi:hypothetical protein